MRLSGFTLIELSIVIIVIGLLTSGIFVGRDLIHAAEIRQQIAQFEQLDTAVQTFRIKYNALPGDIRADAAASSGFVARSGAEGHGDGNQVIGNCNVIDTAIGCEMVLFWSDLSLAKLIPYSFPSITDAEPAISDYRDSFTYFPKAKLGYKATIAVTTDLSYSKHWFATPEIAFSGPGAAAAQGGIPVPDAHSIDSKIDDGLPNTGNVLAKLSGELGAAFFFEDSTEGALQCINNGAYNIIDGQDNCQLTVKTSF